MEGAGKHFYLGNASVDRAIRHTLLIHLMECFAQIIRHAQIRPLLLFRSLRVPQITVESVIKPQDISVVPIQIQKGIQKSFQAFRGAHGRSHFRIGRRTICREIFIPFPCANGDDQIQFRCEIAIHACSTALRFVPQ